MRRFKILLFAIFAGLFSCVILLFALAVYKYHSTPVCSELPQLSFKIPEGSHRIGDMIPLEAEFYCSWTLKPERAHIELPEGLQLVGSPQIRLSATRWAKWKWKIIIEIQGYRPGEYGSVKGFIEFVSKDSGIFHKDFELSSIKVHEIPLADGEKINIAGKIDAQTKKKLFFAIFAIAAFVIAFAIFAFYRWKISRKKEVKVLPVWTLALDALRKLRISHRDGLIRTEKCVEELCDIIRDYLEQYLGFKAPHMTTPEFLDGLKRSDSPLSSEHKSFLAEFMNSAELVKFAKAPADEAVVEEAISKAEELVKSTVKENLTGRTEK